MKSSWSLGPDSQEVLLRFIENFVAAQGDIINMFYSVRVATEDEQMQIIIRNFFGEDQIHTFTMDGWILHDSNS